MNYNLVELVCQCESSVHNAENITLHKSIYFQASAYGKIGIFPGRVARLAYIPNEHFFIYGRINS